MKLVKWEDEKGWKRAALVTDDMPEEDWHMGMTREPPGLEGITWNDCLKQIHNQLVDLGIFSLEDVQRHQTAVGNVVCSVIRRRIIELFKEHDREVKG